MPLLILCSCLTTTPPEPELAIKKAPISPKVVKTEPVIISGTEVIDLKTPKVILPPVVKPVATKLRLKIKQLKLTT